MGILRLNCPWCKIANSAFDILRARAWQEGMDQCRQIAAQCGGCSNWVLIDAEVNYQHRALDLKAAAFAINRDVFARFTVWPPEPSTDAPQFTPEGPARAFTQALKSLHGKNWDAAGMMARKAMELATGILEPTFTRADGLKKRIRALGAAHKITPQLVDWADAIREGGNDAAHDDFTEEEAKLICEFAETFLEYVFTMQGKLAARKAKFAPPKPPAKP